MKALLKRFRSRGRRTGSDRVRAARGFISLVAVVAITQVGQGVNGVYGNINSQVQKIPGAAGDPKVIHLLKRFVREEKAEDLIQYALLAGFISLVAVVAITQVGQGVNGVYNNISTSVEHSGRAGS